MLCLLSSMCASNSLYVLLKISIKTFWCYSEQYKTLPNLISYHTKKSQLPLIFVTASNTFSVMHKFYILLYSHNSWISTFVYNWNRTMLVSKEKVKSDYFPRHLHHCSCMPALSKRVQYNSHCNLSLALSLRDVVCGLLGSACTYKCHWNISGTGRLLSHIMATYADCTLI